MSYATQAPQPRPQSADFHGAALIDAQGREVPITEAMVLQACQSLEDHWRYPLKPCSAG